MRASGRSGRATRSTLLKKSSRFKNTVSDQFLCVQEVEYRRHSANAADQYFSDTQSEKNMDDDRKSQKAVNMIKLTNLFFALAVK